MTAPGKGPATRILGRVLALAVLLALPNDAGDVADPSDATSSGRARTSTTSRAVGAATAGIPPPAAPAARPAGAMQSHPARLRPDQRARLRPLARAGRERHRRRSGASLARAGHMQLASLRRSDLLRIAGDPRDVAGVVHESYWLYKQGLPVLNRGGRIHRRNGALLGQTGRLGIPPLSRDPATLSREEAVARARAAAPGRGERAPPRVRRGWLALEEVTVPAWQVTLPVARPLGTWQLEIDARNGEVLRREDRLLTGVATGSGSVYAENVVTTPGPVSLPLPHMDGDGFLRGRFTQVFDVRTPEAYRPDLVFDFAESDARFVQTSLYRGLTLAGDYAEQRGLADPGERVLTFSNLYGGPGDEQFNNAFYDPFFPIFGFGNGDGSLTANLGTDLDVAIHEMGHHVFSLLVDPTDSLSLSSVAAINEGFADTLAALVNDDPEIGESTIPGQPYLRNVDNDRIWPDDTDLDPHVEGLIYAGLNWDLAGALGNDLTSGILIAGLPFLDPSSDFVAQSYRDALLAGDQAVNAGAAQSTIEAAADARGIVAREEIAFRQFLEEGVGVSDSLADNDFHVYLFQEFPGSLQLTARLSGSGDADLLVAPLGSFDPDDPSTYFFSSGVTSVESVTVATDTIPSVDDDDVWLIAVEDYPDGQPSGYTVRVTSVLPPPAIAPGGSYQGTIAESGDFELISFEGSAGEIVRLEGTALSEDLDIAVTIFDPYDFEIFGADDDSAGGTDPLIQGAALPRTQTYGIAIFSIIADLDPTVGVGDYRLDLSLCENTGPDLDGDGLADVCDDDDDDDGFIDAFDTDPLDAALCQDIEGDGCDDCVSGAFAPFDDGANADGDHLCDAGDPDDDNDGCADEIDDAPLTPSVDDDLDLFGDDCDNCPVDYNPGQIDTDGDGLGDVCDPTPNPEPGSTALGVCALALLAALRRRRRAHSRTFSRSCATTSSSTPADSR